MEKDQYLLASTYNALQVLDLLSRRERLGVAEISKALQLGKASVFRMLYTLEKAGFVQKSENAKYDLGVKFALYGSLVVERLSIVQICRPFLEDLRDHFGETAYLSILTGSGKMVFIAKQHTASSLQMYARIGEEREAYCTASGKAMLAFIDSAESERFAETYEYRAHTPRTITSPGTLLEELARVREKGYAVDREEAEIGLVCFSGPVLDHRGGCVAAMSLSGPASRMYGRQNALVDGILRASRAVSAQLGYESRKK